MNGDPSRIRTCNPRSRNPFFTLKSLDKSASCCALVAPPCNSCILPTATAGGNQMSVRKRTWATESGEAREAYVVQYSTPEPDKRGKRKRHIKTFDRKKDADAFHAQVRVDIGRGVHVPSSKSITVEAAGRNWIDSCGDLERTSPDQYLQHLKFHIL